MLFDRLCFFAERDFLSPEIENLLRAAHIFLFEKRFHELFPAESEARRALFSSQREFWNENFFLPFPVAAIEDTASVVILADTVAKSRGLAPKRLFVECVPLSPERIKEFAHYFSEEGLDSSREGEKRYIVAWGEIAELRFMENSDKYIFICKSTGAKYLDAGDKPRVLVDFSIDSELLNLVVQESAGNAVVAMEEVMYFNSPSRFVVERRAAEKRHKQGGKEKRIPRSPERSHYILLEPRQIRELFGLPETGESTRSVSPHLRRKHFHTFRDPRFAASGKQGKTIVIPATWVGDTERRVGKSIYKVRLDL